MKNRNFLLAALLTSAALPLPAAAQDMTQRFRLEVETGAAWQDRNDVQIPNDASGTRFSLRDTVGDGPFAILRLDAAWSLNQRQDIRVLFAPLSYEEDGTLPGNVNFQGRAFAAGPVQATWKFNSWRATWRYRVLDDSAWLVKLGITANVRDAEITLRQGNITATDTDVGLVPLFHAYVEYRLTERWKAILDADALAAPQGRAFDVGLKAGYDFDRSLGITAGYRILDGGADNDEVYAFARFNQAVVSLVYRF
jgi:hypothetical protein